MTTLTPPIPPSNIRNHFKIDVLKPLRQWLNGIQIHNHRVAHLICNLIPCTCPFERDITLFDRTFHIPSLCKLNPLYNELIYLRFRALSYLSDVCSEDVSQYIC